MEMLAVYFALRDNLAHIRSENSKRHLLVQIRSDSRSTIEQLAGAAEIRDGVMRRILSAIGRLLAKVCATISFGHLYRSENVAGFMLEQRRRKEIERAFEMSSMRQFYPLSLCA